MPVVSLALMGGLFTQGVDRVPLQGVFLSYYA